MWYADNKCTCKEKYKPEHTYTFLGYCVASGEIVEVTVKAEDLFKYRSGRVKYIQDAFPYLSPDEREFLMSGFYNSPSLDPETGEVMPKEQPHRGNEYRLDHKELKDQNDSDELEW